MNQLLLSRLAVLLPALAAAMPALAQVPTIISVVPAANARAAGRSAVLTATFSQPLTAASAGALKVFSSQRGGLRSRATTPAAVSGNALSFAPTTYPYLPGETVQYTVTTGAASSGGPLAQARVGQFTAAAGSAGGGVFGGGVEVGLSSYAASVVLGDVDGDGDLDVVAGSIGTGTGSTVRTVLNNGRGTFASGQTLSVSNPLALVMGDVDGDGDLDLVASNGGSTVSVLQNNGTGTFTSTQQVSAMVATNLVLGDIDGDGDLDLVANNATIQGLVSVRLNNGSGTFSGTQTVSLGAIAQCIALGDVDADGDLDLVAGTYSSGSSSSQLLIRLNNGSGTFSGSQQVSGGYQPGSLALGDLDGDGDLDLVAANTTPSSMTGTVSVRLNDGSGNFSGTQDVPVGLSPIGVTLADVDGDGDLDFLTANRFNVPGTSSLRLNDGSGTFSGTQEVAVDTYPISLATGDVDNDGDLDLLTVNYNATGTVSVRLNGGTTLAAAAAHTAASFLLAPNPTAQRAATLTGAAAHVPIAVLDALGRPVLSTKADADGTASLALPAGLAPGLYLVRAGMRTARLVVE